MIFPRAKYSDTTDWTQLENPVATKKHDGASFYMIIGKDGSPRYISRRISVTGDHIDRTAQLPHLSDKKLPEFAGHVYNVELVHTGHTFSGKEDHPKLSGILNSLPAKSIDDQKREGPIRAILLDVVHPKLPTYGDKLKHLGEVVKTYDRPSVLRSVSVKIGKDKIQELIDSTKGLGQEGVIVTSLTKPEDSNVRVKVKHTNTWNLRVAKVNQEFDIKGNPKESAGSLTVVDSTGREVANVGTGLSRELRQSIWNNKDSWIGKEIQVKARNPSRQRLIAPVYNGESDGSMDKVASTLEDQLLNALISRYAEKGVNMQKILDNPLFQQLPLAKKIAFLEQANSPISSPTKLNLSPIGVGTVGGGIAGAIGTVMFRAMNGAQGPLSSAALIGAAGGAMFGGLGGVIRSLQDKSRDESTRLEVSKGSFPTLIKRYESIPVKGSPFGGNRYLDALEGLVDTKVPVIANFSSSLVAH